MKSRETRINHLLMFILLAISGFPFFYTDPLMKPVLLLGCLIGISEFRKRRLSTDSFILVYLTVFIALSVGQILLFEHVAIVTILSYILRIMLAYITVRVLGNKFIQIYIRQLYFFVIISFFFYFGTLISGEIEHFFIDNICPIFELPQEADSFYKSTPNIIFFNFNSLLDDPTETFLRNSGPFWEPGAFSGFLIIGLIFNIVRTKKIFNRENIFFMTAVLTTFSTSGYIALFLFVLFYLINLTQSKIKFVLIPALIALSLYSYFQLEFLSGKITRSQMSITRGNTSNRFISALRDIDDIKEYWLFGRGMNEATRYSNSSYLRNIDKHRNNGVTAIFVNIGVIGGFLYFFLFRKSLNAICVEYGAPKAFSWMLLFLILIIGFSEIYFTKVFFISLTMLHLTYSRKEYYSKII